MGMPGMPGQESIVDGYEASLDDGTTGGEVVHKTDPLANPVYGFVHTVNVVVSGNAYIAGCTFQVRNGTGAADVKYSLVIPALGAARDNMAFPVIFDSVFDTDIRTIITIPNMGTMTVTYA